MYKILKGKDHNEKRKDDAMVEWVRRKLQKKGEKTTIHKSVVLKSEVKRAMAEMKKNKATDPNENIKDMITDWDDLRTDKFTEAINEIYNCSKIPKDM